jgi:hypothetical protein
MGSSQDEWEDVTDTSAPVKADQIKNDGVNDSGSLMRMAESWYEGITEEEVKKKMILHYVVGITTDDFGREDAKELMRAHGFDIE